MSGLREAVAELDHNIIQHSLSSRGLKWIFSPPAESHICGIWDMLIWLVKKVFYSTIRQQSMDDESFQTLTCEIEAILNALPITKASDNVNDLEAHLIIFSF